MLFTGTSATNSRAFMLIKVFIAILLFGIAFNVIATLKTGFSPDELAYVDMAKEQVLGRPLYLTYVDHQPPGTAFAGMAFVALFGSTVLAAKVSVIFFVLLSTASIGTIALAVTRSRLNSIFAAALGGYFISVFAQFVGFNPSFFAAAYLLIGVACFTLPIIVPLSVNSRRRLAPIWSILWTLLGGAFLALAFLSKPSAPVEFPAVILLIYVLRRSWRFVIWLAIGFLLTLAATFLYFAATGQFSEFIYASFIMNLGYIGGGLFGLELFGQPPNRLQFLKEIVLPRTLPYYSGLLLLAGAVFIWTRRHTRFLLLLACVSWVILAAINGALSPAMDIRHFVHIIGPLAILACLGIDVAIRLPGIQICVVVAALLMIFPQRFSAETETFKYQNDYQPAVDILNKTLQKNDCVLTWGWLGGLNYFSDYRPCSRVAIEGDMYLREIYDIRHIRTWYLQDILTSKPKLLARQYTWPFYSQLDRLLSYRLPQKISGVDGSVTIDFYSLNWTSYHDSNGNINHEIDLLGYDLVPDRQVEAGNSISITFYWRAMKQPTGEYQGFIQLLTSDYAGKVAGIDALPTDPYYSTVDWKHPGEVIVGSTYHLTIPANTAPGTYPLVTGMYRVQGGVTTPLPHYDNRATEEAGNFLNLGTITVRDGKIF